MNNLLYINWDIDPEMINLGGLSIRYYGLLFAVGLLLCSWILKKIFDRDNIPDVSILVCYCLFGIIIGARLGHCLFYEPTYYLSHPWEIILPINFNNGEITYTGYQGLASHGGALGLIIALIIYAVRKKQDIIKTFDYLAIVAPLGACFIRLANLMNSEIIGRPTDVPWAFIFKRVDAQPRHPAQLYEAIAYLSFFVIVYYLYRTNKKRKTGYLFGLVLTMIFTFRFVIEFIKENQVGFEETMLLDMGQLLSIPYVLLGLFFMFLYTPRKTNSNMTKKRE